MTFTEHVRYNTGMKLLTKELESKLPALYSGDGADPNTRQVVAKFFCPWNNWTWYVLEGEKNDDGDVLFFGLVQGHERELGYFSLRELASVRGPFGLSIERDRHFTPITYAELTAKLDEGKHV